MWRKRKPGKSASSRRIANRLERKIRKRKRGLRAARERRERDAGESARARETEAFARLRKAGMWKAPIKEDGYVVRLEMIQRGARKIMFLAPRPLWAARRDASDGNFYHPNIRHTVEAYRPGEFEYEWADPARGGS